MIREITLVLGMLCASAAVAQDVTQRPLARALAATGDAAPLIRPQARTTEPDVPAVSQDDVTPVPMRPVIRPYEEPLLARGAATHPQRRAEQNLFAFSPTAPAFSQRPTGRSARFVQIIADKKAALVRGQVCGDPAIQGDAIGAVDGRGACGIDSAVRLRTVAGVQIRPTATVDCPTAQALKSWISAGVQPITGGQTASLRVVSHYACRNRNSAASGRLSEHAFGRAIDIAGIGLKDGREITVLTGWNTQRDGPALRQMWQAACGPFGTVLGPNANRFHRDHFHFDTARYRSGPYCR